MPTYPTREVTIVFLTNEEILSLLEKTINEQNKTTFKAIAWNSGYNPKLAKAGVEVALSKEGQ